jgi:hypothetical protein
MLLYVSLRNILTAMVLAAGYLVFGKHFDTSN